MFRRLHPSTPGALTTHTVRSVSRRVTLGVLLIWVALLGATPPASAAPASASPASATPASASPGSAAPPASSAAAPASAAAASSAAASASSGSPRLQSLLDELVAEGASGAIALVDDGTRTIRLAAGAARLDPHLPLRPDARVRVGSITKTFVSTVALQLVGEGRLRLDDTVQRWLPGLVPGGGGITVRQLLNHTSGLYDYTQDPQLWARFVADPRALIPPRRLVAVATAHPPLFPPGAGWSYSNTNYILAGLIEEAVTAQSLGQLIDTRIVTPLHLSGTSFPARTWRIGGYHAHGYFPPALTGTGYFDVTDQSGSIWHAAGAVISTADDLRRFYSALLSGRLLRPEQLQDEDHRRPRPDRWLRHGDLFPARPLRHHLGTQRWRPRLPHHRLQRRHRPAQRRPRAANTARPAPRGADPAHRRHRGLPDVRTGAGRGLRAGLPGPPVPSPAPSPALVLTPSA